jgi:hypothetical protein
MMRAVEVFTWQNIILASEYEEPMMSMLALLNEVRTIYCKSARHTHARKEEECVTPTDF